MGIMARSNLRSRRPRRKAGRKMRNRPMRSLRSRHPIFTEVYNAGNILPDPTGFVSGVLAVNFNSLPQASSYSALYRRFKILKCVWTLMPRFSGADLGTAQYNSLVVGGSLGGWSAGRLVYAVDDTPAVQAPATELALLGSNGVKILPGMKKIVIVNRPKPLVASFTGATGSAMTFNSNPWLNTDNSSNQNSGTGINHFGVRYAYTQPVAASATPTPFYAYDIFCKVTICLADPA